MGCQRPSRPGLPDQRGEAKKRRRRKEEMGRTHRRPNPPGACTPEPACSIAGQARHPTQAGLRSEPTHEASPQTEPSRCWAFEPARYPLEPSTASAFLFLLTRPDTRDPLVSDPVPLTGGPHLDVDPV
jgi:hypothetical protein